jgi:hypothetical protein
MVIGLGMRGMIGQIPDDVDLNNINLQVAPASCPCLSMSILARRLMSEP